MTTPNGDPTKIPNSAELNFIMTQQFCGEHVGLKSYNRVPDNPIVLDGQWVEGFRWRTAGTHFEPIVPRLYEFLSKPTVEPTVLAEIPEGTWRGDRARPDGGALAELRGILGTTPQQVVRNDLPRTTPNRDPKGTAIRKVALISTRDEPKAEPLRLLLIEDHREQWSGGPPTPVRRISIALGLPADGGSEADRTRVLNLVNEYSFREQLTALDYISGIAALGDTPEAILRSSGLNRWTAPTRRDIWLATHPDDPILKQTRKETVYHKRAGSLPR